MRHKEFKQLVLLLGLLIPTAWCGANCNSLTDGYSHIQIKEAHVEEAPKGFSIQASINGHYLAVVFSENLGQVYVELTTASGTPIDCLSTQTPNGVNIYITLAGDYIVTFTLSNGDEYYGEFTVTD